MSTQLICPVALAIAFGVTGVAHAAVYVADPTGTRDAEVRAEISSGTLDGSNLTDVADGPNEDAVNITNGDNRLGRRSGTVNAGVVYLFELPTLGANEVVTNVSLSLSISNTFFVLEDIDLYALNAQAAGDKTIVPDDFYVGPSDPTDAILLEDNWIADSGAVQVPANTYTLTNDAELTSYIEDAYNTVGAGGNVLFRVNQDVLSNAGASNFASIRNGNTALRPSLEITTTVIPEPASLGLLAIGTGLLFGRTRRRHA